MTFLSHMMEYLLTEATLHVKQGAAQQAVSFLLNAGIDCKTSGGSITVSSGDESKARKILKFHSVLLKSTLFESTKKTSAKKPPVKKETGDICITSPNAFLGRWIFSRKDTISAAAIAHWAKKYPYSGKAFRLDTSPYGAPLTSWCRTLDGMEAWTKSNSDNPLGIKPHGWHYYSGTIKRGIDLAKMARSEGHAAAYMDTIIKVDEVTPIVPVTDIKEAP